MIGLLAAGLVGGAFAAMLGVTAFDAVARPSLRRLAIRNIARRPTEAALVVVGTMLGTAIITAALIAGDTFERSIVDVGRRELGPIDVRARVDGLDRAAELDAAFAGFDRDDVDGRLTMTTSGAAIATLGDEPRAEPAASIAEVDFDAARRFGGDPASTGFSGAGPTPTEGTIVVGHDLADRLEVGVGDEVAVHAHGRSAALEVAGVLPEVGLGGYRDAYLAPGAISWFAEGHEPGSSSPPVHEVLVSNRGGVFDGAEASEDVVAAVEELVAGLPDVQVQGLKADLLDDAREEGDEIGQLFSMVGSFSVLVGILLLVNLFVMLAEERKQELGMLRAVGLKRNHLLRAFSIEGAIYAVLAAAVGGAVGIGVGWVMGQVTQGILAAEDPDFEIVFSAERGSVLAGVSVGLVIALVTVWLTSARIAGLNVIRAIRDLPEPTAGRVTLRSTVLGSLGVALGTLAFSVGTMTGAAVLLMAGPPAALLSSIPILRRWLGERWSVLGPSAVTLVWGQAVFRVFEDRLDNAGVEVFIVQGVVLTAAGVLMLSTADGLWRALTARLVANGRGLASHLALAYPLARRVRTGILLAMFSLIVFVITFMSVFIEIFGGQARSFADADRGGFEVLVESNPANPVGVEQLLAAEGVTGVAGLTRGFAEFSTSYEPDPTWWSTTGFDRALVDGGAPDLARRAPRFGSDDEVYESILASASHADRVQAIVPEFFLSGNGPNAVKPELGGTVRMESPFSDEVLEFEIVGTTDADFVFNGLLTARPVLESFLGSNVGPGRFYVDVGPEVDPDDLVARLDGAFLAHGVRSDTFLHRVQVEMAEQEGFFRLMQGYLGLGLLIGVAGLGVVMVRAVRERRRQIGILRAMGFHAATVRRAFLAEAAFIATQGIALGIGLGLLTAYQVMVSSSVFGETTLPFAVPWGSLLVILAVPLVAALLATVAPAAQASAIRPAAALRVAD